MMSHHNFPSFNFPNTASADLRQSVLDYGKTGPVAVFKIEVDKEQTIKCIPQKKEIKRNKITRFVARKPTLPLSLPNKLSSKSYLPTLDSGKSDWDLQWGLYESMKNFSSDHAEILYGKLAELAADEIKILAWENSHVILKYKKPQGKRLLEKFQDDFSEIPLEILNEFCKESVEEEKLELTGKYYGNCLTHQVNTSCQSSNVVLAYPSGESMNTLNLGYLQVGSENEAGLFCELFPKKETFDLPGRICQINSAAQSKQSCLIALRTDYTCSFFKSEFGQEGDKEPTATILGNVACKTKPCSLAVNPFIPGEVVIAMETGSLCMWCEKNTSSLQVVKPCSSCVPEDFDWFFCEFGPHPRQVIRANQANVEMIDLRDSSCGGKDLITLPSSHFFNNDHFTALQRHPDNPYHYVLGTTQFLVLMDERFQQNPVLKWGHSLKDPIKYINVVPDVFPDSKDVLILAGGYKAHEVHCFQYCYGENTAYGVGMDFSNTVLPPRSTCSPWKISSYSEWPEMINYPNRAEIILETTNRLNQPLLGQTCILNSHNSKNISVIQLSKPGDLFYQCLSAQQSRLNEERDQGEVYYYEDMNIDVVSSGGCGSSRVDLTTNDQNLVDNWFKSVLEQHHEDTLVKLQESKFYPEEDVASLRGMIFSEMDCSSDCTFCGTSVSKNLSGGCIYCGLNKDLMKKLSLAATTEPTVLTKVYLGTEYKADELKLFKDAEDSADPLGIALLKNWDSDVHVPVNLSGENKEDTTEQRDGTEMQDPMLKPTDEKMESFEVEEETNAFGSCNVLSPKTPRLASSQVSANGRQARTPSKEMHVDDIEEGHVKMKDGFSPSFRNQMINSPRTPSSQLTPKSSAKKKKLARVAGF